MDAGAALLLAVVSDLAIASAYLVAGVSLAGRVYTREMRRAGRMFSLWWFGIGATAILSMLLAILALRGAPPGIIDALDQMSLATCALGIAGFVSYLGFIYFGRHVLDAPMAIGYGALVLWSASAAAADPAVGYHVEGWRPIVERAHQGFGPSPTLAAMLLVLPIVAATIAYARLFWRADDREGRFRIALVASALVGWNVGVAVVSLPFLADAPVAQVIGRALILASASGIVVAFRPPRRIRKWLGHADAALASAERAARLASRIRQLV